MSTLKVSAALKASNINGYSDEGVTTKAAFHTQGKAFLKNLANALEAPAGGFSIRSNLGGMAVSGEVTLHTNDLYVQLFESCTQRGVQMMYRSCDSQKDYCGQTNHFVTMSQFSQQPVQSQVLDTMRRLIKAEQARKETAPGRRCSVTA